MSVWSVSQLDVPPAPAANPLKPFPDTGRPMEGTFTVQSNMVQARPSQIYDPGLAYLPGDFAPPPKPEGYPGSEENRREPEALGAQAVQTILDRLRSVGADGLAHTAYVDARGDVWRYSPVTRDYQWLYHHTAQLVDTNRFVTLLDQPPPLKSHLSPVNGPDYSALQRYTIEITQPPPRVYPIGTVTV